MEKRKTKQIILEEALNLFSVNGYDSTSVAEIAGAVGIKAAALYKHYKNKQDIFNAILQEMANRYEKYMNTMQMNGFEANKDVDFFMKISEEQLINVGIGLFSYFLHDEYTCKFRKILTIEQYHNPHLANIYVKQYLDDPLSFQGAMFSLFVQAGFMIPEDSQIMALHFYAPIFLYLKMCDGQPEREAEAVEMIKKHIIQFNKLYRKLEA